jgi:hypothetical protein
MTIILLQPDGVPITAQQERQGSAALYGGGSGRPLGGRSGFRVDTPSDVFTATASAWTLKPCSIMIDPGASTHQGMYGWATDTNITQASVPGSPVAPNDTYPRKDIYFIRVNDSSAGDGSGLKSAPVEYLAGTPSATPAEPDLPPRSFLIATVTVPQVGAGSPSVVLNPARFAAAGAPLPVYSENERDGLSKYDGLTVQRRDLPGDPLETYDGKSSKWGVSDVGWTNLATVQGFTANNTSGWSGIKYAVKSGWVVINGSVQRGTPWGNDQTIAVMPANLKPAFKVQGANGLQVEPTVGNVTLSAGSTAASFFATWPLF